MDRLELINRALVRIGEEPIANESVPGADTHIAIYESVTRDLLSRYPWSFAKTTRRLARLTAAPEQHWQYQFQLPTDMIGAPRAVYASADCRQPTTSFALAGTKLLSDWPDIWLLYGAMADPVYWPGYFAELDTLAVMAEFAGSICEDFVKRERLRDNVYGSEQMMGEGGLLGQAKGLDSQAQPSAVIAEGRNPLIDARFS